MLTAQVTRAKRVSRGSKQTSHDCVPFPHIIRKSHHHLETAPFWLCQDSKLSTTKRKARVKMAARRPQFPIAPFPPAHAHPLSITATQAVGCFCFELDTSSDTTSISTAARTTIRTERTSRPPPWVPVRVPKPRGNLF